MRISWMLEGAMGLNHIEILIYQRFSCKMVFQHMGPKSYKIRMVIVHAQDGAPCSDPILMDKTPAKLIPVPFLVLIPPCKISKENLFG